MASWKPAKNRGFYLGTTFDTPVTFDNNWKAAINAEARLQEKSIKEKKKKLPVVQKVKYKEGASRDKNKDLPRSSDSSCSLPTIETSSPQSEAKMQKAFQRFLKYCADNGRAQTNFEQAQQQFNIWTLKNPSKRSW
eukprot:JP437515.1.p1 GENE.JP437515.1~~JP437515.1.p1  ORF type:complete len:136 (+),score=19.48 JP437515.1:91-498(+)